MLQGDNIVKEDARFNAIMDTILDGLLIINSSGIVQNFNAAATRIFGYEPEEVIGQNIKMLMPEPYHSEHDNYLHNYLVTGKAKVIGIGREVKARRKNGSIFPMELSINEAKINGERMFVGTIRDISERKEFEKHLVDKAGHLDAVVNTVLDGIITIDGYGIIHSFNPAAVRIFGYESEEVIGKNVKMLMPDPYHSEHDGYLHNYLVTGEAKIVGIGREVQAKRKDGTVFPMELGINETRIKGQRMFVGTIRDITEQKKLQTQVSENIYLTTIMNTILDGIIIIDEHGIVQSFNPAAVKMFGYDQKEVLGQNIKMLVPKEHAVHHDDYLANYLKTGKSKVIGGTTEIEVTRKDGSMFLMDLLISEMEINGKRMFVGTVRDATGRKQAEKMLIDEKKHLKAVVNTVIDGILTIDEKGVIHSFNPSASRIFGYSAKEIIGEELKILMPDPNSRSNDDYIEDFLHIDEDEKVKYIGRQAEAKRKDGSFFPVEFGINEMEKDGERMFVAIIRDISERKKADESISDYINKLELSNQELDDFAYIASHDLKEPLRGMSNNVLFLQEDYEELLGDDGNQRFERVIFLCKRMENLIDNLLYFSRLGRQDLAIKDVDLNEVINDITEMSYSFIEEKNAKVIIPKPLPNIQCDATRITEVFRNLITNAIKYNDKDEKIIEIGAKKEDDKTIFYVKDNGVGIDKTFHEDIFRIFKRLNNESDGERGSGVGLTFVKKIIERHEGKIWLESEPGIGTSFFFYMKT